MSQYLLQTEFLRYGAPESCTENDAVQASIMIDAFLGRPEGLVYTVGADGLPCYMSALAHKASQKFTSITEVVPGTNVTISLHDTYTTNIPVGSIVIVDRRDTRYTEACTVVGTRPGHIILNNVLFSHATGCILETNLGITEERTLPKERTTVVLAKSPIVRVFGGVGRYGYRRRGDIGNHNVNGYNLMATMSQFGGPPAWELWSGDNSSFEPQTGYLWVPAGMLLNYYTEIRVTYISGFPFNGLPDPIKLATAKLMRANLENPLIGNVSNLRNVNSSVQNFTSSSLSDDVKAMLRPWLARSY